MMPKTEAGMDADITLPSAANPERDESYAVHIVPMEPEFNGEDFVVALCGVKATFNEDGDIRPPEFDFFFLGRDHEKATCSKCRATLNL